MLKKFLFLSIIPSFFLSAADNINPTTTDLPKLQQAATNKELAQLDDLITATQRSLEQLNNLKSILTKYQEAQAVYLQNENNVELLYKMIKLAHKALAIIQENHLSQSFDTAFLNELTLFAQMANKLNSKA